MTTQEITLNQSSDADLYTKLLRGRYVTSINNDSITLNNGLILTIKGNEGCMACPPSTTPTRSACASSNTEEENAGTLQSSPEPKTFGH